ncbi:MAG: TonB-dependent receptor [Vicinamibacterales bacterium]
MSVTTRAAGVLCVLLIALPVSAQSPASSPQQPPLGTTLSADVLDDLPIGDSAYAFVETTQPEVIADSFYNGGLNVGADARLAGFLGSWSQTLFRVGDLDISDPSGSGAALFVPNASMWQSIRVNTGLMPADINTPGLAVTFEPRRAGQTWERVISINGASGGFAAGPPANQPIPIARLKSVAEGAGRLSGPLSERASFVGGFNFTRGSRYFREQLPDSSATDATGFAHLTFTPNGDRDMHALAVVQRTSRPFGAWHAFQDAAATTGTTAMHLQASLDAHPADRARWRAFAGFTGRFRSNDLTSRSALIERLVDGPVPQAVDEAADTSATRIALGARMVPYLASGSPHRLEYGLDLGTASTRTSDTFAGTVTELVDGAPARLWTYSSTGDTSVRRTTTIAAFASDVITLSPKTTIDAALRGEFVRGLATGSATAVNWISLLPRVSLRYALSERRSLTVSYARSGNALTHNWLAFGDPSASTATVAAFAAPAIVVSKVGPGTGGVAAFSGITSGLKRPTADEFVVGFEKRRSETMRYTLTGIIRRETNLLGVTPTWTAAPYTSISISDAGQDYLGAGDDRALLGYNRTTASFGKDGYLVSNPAQKAARAYALRMSWEYSGERLFALFGATASAAQGPISNRGYGPYENDQDQPGEVFTNPNASAYAFGRLFSDRAFTIKWTTRYRLPYDVTVAAIARYQDGQPFARMVVFPNLNQGAEAVQAYPNAGSRFTFTGTFDFRAQKRVAIGNKHADVVFDAYNLFTRNNEVEEYVVGGPAYRTSTAIQPPRSIHLGLRLTF